MAQGTNPAVATDGATLIHGNYCGAGNRPGKPPIDALDLACMNHDACTPPSGIPTCDCNIRLRDEAAAVAADPRQAPELRSLASLTSAAAQVMICKPVLDTATAPVRPPVPAAPVPAAPSAAVAAPVAPAPSAAAPVATAPVAAAPVVGPPVSIVPDSVAPSQEAVQAPAVVPPAAVPADVAPAAPGAMETEAGALRRRSMP